jgi:hypothetical protein
MNPLSRCLLLLALLAQGPAIAQTTRDTVITTVVAAADEQPAPWRYTTSPPSSDWFKPDFNALSWLHGNGGFGSAGTPGAIISTTWETPGIWLRRDFDLPDPLPADLHLWMIHDEDAEIYLNGVPALRVSGWTTDYQVFPIDKTAGNALKPGRNTLAIHCRQTSGGQAIDAGLVSLAPAAPSKTRWSAARANEWFARQPLPVGFNYVPANAISYTEMWMEDTFDPELIDRELAVAQEVGFNCLRVVLPFVVWEAEADAFKRRFESFLAICDKRGIKVTPCFFDDCVFGTIVDPVFGKQPEMVKGWYANGWTPSPGHARARDPLVRPALESYVKDVMSAHRDDPRILYWDLYNEPSNSGMGNAALPLLRDVFRWAREINPTQPVTSGIWGGSPRVTQFLKSEPDIITFHNYNPADHLRAEIRDLKRLGRPVVCTEWLNRPRMSLVETCLQVFIEEGVGALHWGLVNGRTQTDLPWGHKPGNSHAGPWQHDIFRPDHSPYDPKEIELFKSAILNSTARQKPE